MGKQISEKETDKKINTYLVVIIIQSLIAATWLLLLPGEKQNAQFLGYSFRRLALLIPITLTILIGLLFKSKLLKILMPDQLLAKNHSKTISAAVICIGILTAILWSVIFLYHFLRIFGDVGIYDRLLPLITNYLLIGLDSLLLVIIIFRKKPKERKTNNRFSWIVLCTTFLIIIISALIISWTGWGYAKNRLVIVSLGVPLLEGQIWYITGLLLILLISTVACHSVPRVKPISSKIKWDIVILCLIWLAAVVLWASQPLPDHNYFAPSERERPPNFEKYPFSDAEQYDYNSLFVLYGTTNNFVISKPLYVSFLAILHAIAGLDYNRVVFLQILVIASYPCVLYLIGRELHSRLGGITLALFVIFRELNSIQASTMANVSNTKLLLSEGFAALLMSLLALVLIRWFKSTSKKNSGYSFIAGGITGALILTRLQTMALIPLLVLLVIFRYYRSLKKVLIGISLLFLGCALILFPVLIRNHEINGVYWVDNPSSTSLLYSYYTLDTGIDIEIPEAETQSETIRRNISVMTQVLVTAFGKISDLIMDNFMRNEISSFLTIPIRLGNKPKLIEMLMIRNPFWAELYAKANLINFVVFLLSAAIYALGFSTAYKNNPGPTLVFLALHLDYSFSSALVRLSGWRFIQPADWILFCFFAFGLAEAIRLLLDRFFRQTQSFGYAYLFDLPEIIPPSKLSWKNFLLYSVLFLLSGGFIPLREALLPMTAPTFSREEICTSVDRAIQTTALSEKFQGFETYCLDPETRVFAGIGIYPRYFKSGEGYYDRPENLYFGIQEFNRLVFRIVGKSNTAVFFRTDNPDIEFPNGSTVFVVGRKDFESSYQFLFLPGHQPEIIFSEPLLSGLDSIN